MKVEVISKVTNVNDTAVLQEVLTLLDQATEKANDSLSKNYGAIKAQYGEVLQKLAQ